MSYIPIKFGMSSGGNTSGISGTVSNQIVFAGGNNITLSQSVTAGSATITISAGAGGGAGSNTFGASNLGNTVGTSGVVSGSAVRFAFAGGNNITLSQSLNGSSGTLTISGANQTTQTQNLHNITLSGNTAGAMAHVSSGTLTLAGGDNITLSQNGNAITISGAAGGGGGGFSAGISTGGNTSGSTGIASNQVVFAGGDNITLSQATGVGGNTITISGAAGGGSGGQTLVRYQNMDRGTSAALAIPVRSVMLQRLNQENDLFAGNMTVSSWLMNLSGSASSGASSTQTLAAHTRTFMVGIYTPVASANTVLTLINSATTTFGSSTTMRAYPYYFGLRWLSIHSSQWSSAPAFTQGGDYVFAVLVNTAGTSSALSYIGQNYMNSNQRSGYWGVSTSTGNTTMPHGNYWNAVYSATTTALPNNISGGQVNRNNATAIFIPHIIMNNQYTY